MAQGSIYVIKFNNGCYFIGQKKVSPNLQRAKIYNNKSFAEYDAELCLSHKAYYPYKNWDTINDYQIIKIYLNEKRKPGGEKVKVYLKLKNGESMRFTHIRELRKACFDITGQDELGILEAIKKAYGEIEELFLDNVRVI